MITNRSILGKIATRWEDSGLFKSDWCNLVGGWCVAYFNRYGESPGKAIQTKFENWAARSSDSATIDLVEQFLIKLSGEYENLAEDSNEDYVADIASELFNEVRLRRLIDNLEGHLDKADTEGGINAVQSFGRVEVGVGAGINILGDRENARDAMAEASEPLIVYPGQADLFFSGMLERDAFVSFLGPEKVGKTWVLNDLAWRAMLQRRKVAYFEVGDQSRRQATRRFMVRASHHPWKIRGGFPGEVQYPLHIEREEDSKLAQVVHESRSFDRPLTWQKGWAAFQRILNKRLKGKECLRMSQHPNDSINVKGIEAILQGWERDEWLPDVIVIDYADILAPPADVHDHRQQINTTWKQLRALSQSRHCLVVTATQSDAASYSQWVLTKANFSEDKRKLAHVTGMVGLNVTAEEKEANIMRFNWVEQREGDFSPYRCLHIANCLGVGLPLVKCCF